MSSFVARTALLSVFDKAKLLDLSRDLQTLGCKLLASGGTAATLDGAGIDHITIESLTGYPSMMEGRVKTLHPLVHGGILSRREQDRAEISKHDILEIDVVAVNLYPFAQVISQQGCSQDLAMENIDIGGPTLIRAAAKNHQFVLVVVDPSDYEEMIHRIKEGTADLDYRYKMAAKAFSHVAAYDVSIARYFSRTDKFPDSAFLALSKKCELRYGENPHQNAALYFDDPRQVGTVLSANLLQGKELSYNNIADIDAALDCVKHFSQSACVIVKHGNPCGVAISRNSREAYETAYATDPTSAFGGILAFNVPIDGPTLTTIIEQQFVEVIIAPEIATSAQEVATRRKHLRLLELGAPFVKTNQRHYKQVSGGYLLQDADNNGLDFATTKCVTKRSPTAREHRDLAFAWDVAWHVKSNAIVIAKDQRTVGIGAGQMSRVMSAKIATLKAQEAGLQLAESVLASDAAFPFRDGIDTAAAAGISAVIQPGGLRRDQEVIDAANEHGIAMLFTGIRHFKH